MSNSAQCDLSNKGQILKMQDISPNIRCKCQKQNIFTPRHFQLEGNGFKKKGKILKILKEFGLILSSLG